MNKKLLFNIDEELHKRFKSYCAGNGVPMGKKIEQLIRTWINGHENKRPFEPVTKERNESDDYPLLN